MREQLLQMAMRLKTSPLRHLVPRLVKKAYWRVARSASIYPVMGSRMYLPPGERAGDRGLMYLMGRYEPPVTGLISTLLPDGAIFCDVGANIGVFTLLAAKRVGPSGRVIAFEPVPESADILRRNVALNRYQNVEVIQMAVHDKQGTVPIYRSASLGCDSLFPNPFRATGAVVAVEAVRLDSFPAMRHVDVLKIDAEGSELSVLRSLGNIRPRHVILEYNAERARAAGVNGTVFLQNLLDFGYREISNLDEPTGSLRSIHEGTAVSVNLHLQLCQPSCNPGSAR